MGQRVGENDSQVNYNNLKARSTDLAPWAFTIIQNASTQVVLGNASSKRDPERDWH